MMSALKPLALMIPQVRRVYEERNRYAQRLLELESKLAEYSNKIAELAVSQGNLEQVQYRMSTLEKLCEKAAVDQDHALNDIRRELYAFHTGRAGGAHVADANFNVVTEFPVAETSNDHLQPRGTKNDNTKCPRFVKAIEKVFNNRKPLNVLDLGCAGGGLVSDFVIAGHNAVGIEGSDYSLVWQRAEWPIIPNRLFTSDITKPFHVTYRGQPFKFDLITAWEVFEHIPEAGLTVFLENIRNHLSDSGLVMASVATFEDFDPVSGAIYHATVKPKTWWVDILAKNGMQVIESLLSTADYPRGSGNPRAMDWDADKNPDLGFHICCAKA